MKYLILLLLLLPSVCFADTVSTIITTNTNSIINTNSNTLTASYYSKKSCQIEGTWKKYGGLTASGERFNENDLTAAMWDVPFGTKVKVTNLANGKSVVVRINDRGPAKRLVKKGRVIDLSKMSFQSIAPLSKGIIKVRIEILDK